MNASLSTPRRPLNVAQDQLREALEILVTAETVDNASKHLIEMQDAFTAVRTPPLARHTPLVRLTWHSGHQEFALQAALDGLHRQISNDCSLEAQALQRLTLYHAYAGSTPELIAARAQRYHLDVVANTVLEGLRLNLGVGTKSLDVARQFGFAWGFVYGEAAHLATDTGWGYHNSLVAPIARFMRERASPLEFVKRAYQNGGLLVPRTLRIS